jgi:hypothetical protein
MEMRVVAEVLEGARSTRSHAPRYEPLIRLAEAIRSHRNQKDVFQLLPDELRQVVPFEAMAQYDHTGNRVNWHFSEAYAADRSARISRVSDIPMEETVAWWVDRTQQPIPRNRTMKVGKRLEKSADALVQPSPNGPSGT